MSELELLRETTPAPAPASPRTRARARAALFAKVDASEHRRRRAWFFSASGAVATLAVAVAVFFALGTGGGQSDAAAANLLHKAAKAALTQPGFDALGSGQYIYTKSVDAYLNTSVVGANRSYSALVPSTREIWLKADGTGWLLETSGKATFLSDRDRQLWIEDGRPDLASEGMDTVLRNEDGPTSPMASLSLPSDPDTLYAQLEKQARGNGRGTYIEMFVLIGDSLRESYTTPAQRAALFEVAARLPGVELVDNVTDAVGRTGTGVAIVDKVNHSRLTLIFDPTNYGLMGEQESVLSGNWAGYPAGTVTGHSAYLQQAVVDALKKRP
jgi:RNA polymerase sigma-70 factor (ECF subfamily)